MDQSKRPTHDVVVKAESRWHKVGVAWHNKERDSFTIRFHPLVDLSRLSGLDMKQVSVRAFPRVKPATQAEEVPFPNDADAPPDWRDDDDDP